MRSVPVGDRRADPPVTLPSRPDEKRAMARWLAVMWTVGMLIGLSAPFLPNFGLERVWIDFVIGVVCVPLLVVCLRVGDRMTPRFAGVMLGFGLVAIAGAVLSVGPTPNVYAGAVYSMWVPLYAAMFFPPRVAHWWLAATGVMLATTLATYGQGEMIPVWLNVMASVSIASVVVGRLASRNRTLALHDPLTGLPNRRFFDQMLGMLAAAAARTDRPLTLVSIDLDGFKEINDRLGHAAGDEVLVKAAKGWTAEVRRSDLLARVGGDEFALLLPDADAPAAGALVERMRRATPDVPFSCGIATWDGRGSLDALLAEADRLLYVDKGTAPAS